MPETTIQIPARLHNAADGGHVAGALDIYDDTLAKTQDVLNSEAAYIDTTGGSTAVVPEFDPESDTVWNKAQVLSFTQKAQVKENLGLAEVATTGSYNDLSNKPTIPTVPTNVSVFTNDAGYLTEDSDVIIDANGLAMCMALAQLSNVSTVTSITNPEWYYVLTDSQDKVLCGVKKNGVSYVYASIEEIMACITDSYNS